MKEKEKFLKSISEILEVKKIKEQDNFVKFEQWDSLTALSVIALVNEMFKITISAEGLNKLKKVGKLISFIQTKRKMVFSRQVLFCKTIRKTRLNYL